MQRQFVKCNYYEKIKSGNSILRGRDSVSSDWLSLYLVNICHLKLSLSSPSDNILYLCKTFVFYRNVVDLIASLWALLLVKVNHFKSPWISLGFSKSFQKQDCNDELTYLLWVMVMDNEEYLKMPSGDLLSYPGEISMKCIPLLHNIVYCK